MTARRSVKYLAFALAAGALAAPSPARALTCPASRAAVQVSVKAGAPAIDNTLPQPALQRLAGKAYHRGRTLGLYRADIRARWHTRIGQREEGGEACRWIESIAIDLVAPERTIYIIRERRPGTCPYDTVLAHERKHQATDDAVLAEFARRLEQAVTLAIAGLPPTAPVPAADAAAAQQRLMAPVEAAVRRVLDALETERRVRQAVIDTPREYRRVGAACG
jgi:hypothetical protein